MHIRISTIGTYPSLIIVPFCNCNYFICGTILLFAIFRYGGFFFHFPFFLHFLVPLHFLRFLFSVVLTETRGSFFVISSHLPISLPHPSHNCHCQLVVFLIVLSYRLACDFYVHNSNFIAVTLRDIPTLCSLLNLYRRY